MQKTVPSQETNSAFTFTEEITTRWASRLAGSQACLDCADYLKETLSTFCDRATSDQFAIRPGSFLGYIRINIVLYIVAVVALLFHQFTIALLAANLSILITVCQFFFYREFVDFLFPLKTGKNVFGTIEPSDEVKQQIIISAHHDSAHIFNLLENDPLTYNIKVLRGTLTQLALFLFSWVLVILDLTGFLQPTFYWIMVGALLIAGFNLYHLWYFYNRQRGTPGAGDNMMCVAIAMEIGKYFAQQKKKANPLKHTKLIIASWDAEECGLRGARAFVKKYMTDLQQTKTYNLNLECMYDFKEMHFLDSDLNNFVPLSKDMAQECSTLSHELGYPTKILSFPILAGGTDAAEFAKKGIEATTLVAMSWKERGEKAVYHTTRDTIDAVDKEAVKRSIEIGIQYVLRKEKSIT